MLLLYYLYTFLTISQTSVRPPGVCPQNLRLRQFLFCKKGGFAAPSLLLVTPYCLCVFLCILGRPALHECSLDSGTSRRVPAEYWVRASTTAARQSSTAGVQLNAQVTTYLPSAVYLLASWKKTFSGSLASLNGQGPKLLCQHCGAFVRGNDPDEEVDGRLNVFFRGFVVDGPAVLSASAQTGFFFAVNAAVDGDHSQIVGVHAERAGQVGIFPTAVLIERSPCPRRIQPRTRRR